MSLDVVVLSEVLSICRLPAGSPLPSWVATERFTSVSWTPEETSVVCATDSVPQGVRAETGWRALKVQGPLDFGLTGVLASLAGPLADARIPVFAVSTFDTDYLLVKQDTLNDAVAALRSAGHRVG